MSSEIIAIHTDRKRELEVTEETPEVTALPAAKRQKLKHHQQNFSPSFWDNLSRLWLTTRSLREFDRRTVWPNSPVHADFTGARQVDPIKLVQFAEEGGPNLEDLRAYPSTRKPDVDREEAPNQTMSDIAAATSAYDPTFHQNMIDHGCLPRLYPSASQSVAQRPQNFDAIFARLEMPRASSSALTMENFHHFLDQNTQAVTENKTMSSEIQTIAGVSTIPSLQDVLFNHLEPLIKVGKDALLSQPKVDLYDGNNPSDLATSVRNSLGDYIVPCEATDRPCLPNFFLEAKGKSGDSMVVMRQAWYAGCLGARGVHELRAWIDPETLEDKNAYTIACTYEAGTATLIIYTIHLRRSSNSHYRRISSMPSRRYEYRMSLMHSVSMIDNLASFARGIRLYQNAREWAKEQRDQLCAAANRKVMSLKAASASKLPGSEDELGMDGASG
ncbi:hypothetical protein XANCAGTX0491_000352 [Xanthoria calcicola]